MKYLALSEKLEKDLYLLRQKDTQGLAFTNLYDNFSNIRSAFGIKNWAGFARDFGFTRSERARFSIAISQLEVLKNDVNFFQKKSLQDFKILQEALRDASINVLDVLSKIDIQINQGKEPTLSEISKQYDENIHGVLSGLANELPQRNTDCCNRC